MTLNSLPIRLLEPDNQRRGDLFGRLIKDLFHALGYHEFTLNVPRSGREIDLRGKHRTAGHSALAECKATTDAIGGADLNKFAGVLDIERSRTENSLEGYFVSLNGFKDSALEQEAELATPRFVLLSGEDVVRELIAGHIVVSPQAASAAAGKCLPTDTRLSSSPQLELLAHTSGWCWCVAFSEDGASVAYVLVHADGAPLGEQAAAPIIKADATVGGTLGDRKLIVPRPPSYPDAKGADALRAYRSFLAQEYGRITVDGLPADEHLESKGIALADLFVPMHVNPIEAPKLPSNVIDEPGDDEFEIDTDLTLDDGPESSRVASLSEARDGLGSVVARDGRIAVLGPPGSGKSTLLKRLAVAYGVPGMRTEIADDLPERDWLPFMVRCRQLDDQASTFHQVLQDIPIRAEMPQHAEAFQALTDAALRDGTALILVDGLDEIADPQVRLAFVKQLRTFVGTYPNVQLVVTSREAGFRVVAGALCDVSTSYGVADFDDADIERLTIAWTVLVVSDSPTTRAEAAEIARTILRTDRVRRLARNPLLLTTLLLVRRWVGDLPKKRTALYAKAIEVLLMTWNVEGHKPIDLDDAIPQLAYVAFAMTRNRTQILSRTGLIRLLEDARVEMPEVLGHSEIAPGAFLERIEDRSSLLSLSGHALEDGILVPLYEFKHLTFQEYLAAVAIADGYYPDRRADEATDEIVLPRLNEQQWLEVIPMVGVLVGRRATSMVDALIKVVESTDRWLGGQDDDHLAAVRLLSRFVADEVQMPPATVSRAAETIARSGKIVDISGILTSKYGDTFRDAIVEGFMRGRKGYWHFASVLSEVAIHDHLLDELGRLRPDWPSILDQYLTADATARQRAEGSLMAMTLLYESHYEPGRRRLVTKMDSSVLHHIEKSLRPGLTCEDAAVRYATAWAYAWVGPHSADARRFVPRVLPILYQLWKSTHIGYVKRQFAWTFASQPLLPASWAPLGPSSAEDVAFLMKESHSRPAQGWQREDRRPAALAASYYFGAPYAGTELRAKAMELPAHTIVRSRLLRRI